MTGTHSAGISQTTSPNIGLGSSLLVSQPVQTIKQWLISLLNEGMNVLNFLLNFCSTLSMELCNFPTRVLSSHLTSTVVLHISYLIIVLEILPLDTHYVLCDKNYIKNVNTKNAPRWSKVGGGGGVGSIYNENLFLLKCIATILRSSQASSLTRF